MTNFVWSDDRPQATGRLIGAMTKSPESEIPPDPAPDTDVEPVNIHVPRHLREQRVRDADATPELAGLVALEALIASWLQGKKSDELPTPDAGDICIMANAPVQRAALTLRAAA